MKKLFLIPLVVLGLACKKNKVEEIRPTCGILRSFEHNGVCYNGFLDPSYNKSTLHYSTHGGKYLLDSILYPVGFKIWDDPTSGISYRKDVSIEYNDQGMMTNEHINPSADMEYEYSNGRLAQSKYKFSFMSLNGTQTCTYAYDEQNRINKIFTHLEIGPPNTDAMDYPKNDTLELFYASNNKRPSKIYSTYFNISNYRTYDKNNNLVRVTYLEDENSMPVYTASFNHNSKSTPEIDRYITRELVQDRFYIPRATTAMDPITSEQSYFYIPNLDSNIDKNLKSNEKVNNAGLLDSKVLEHSTDFCIGNITKFNYECE
jgi:hypothetical protein